MSGVSINTKLTTAFAIVVVFLLAIGGTALWFIGTLNTVLEEIDVSHYQLNRVAEAVAGFHNGGGTPAQHQARIRDIAIRAATDWERQRIAEAQALAGDPQRAAHAQQALDELSNYYRSVAEAGQRRLKVLHNRAIKVVILIIIESALLVILLMYLVRRWLLRPLIQLEAAADRLVAGRTPPATAGESQDEMQALTAHLNAVAPTLTDLRDRLEKAERLARVGEAVTFVAHNLGEPLRSIRTLAQYEREGHGVTPDAQAAFAHIISTTQKLEHWIANMASTARTFQPLLGRYALEPILRDVVALVQPRLAAAALTVDLQCDEALPELTADRALLEQALVAILNNAIEASPDGGRITIHAVSSAEGAMEITIADHGAGMGADTQHQAVTAFFTTKRGAAGLGLTVADRIVRLHQGALHIASEHHQGTCVTLRLPVAGPAAN